VDVGELGFAPPPTIGKCNELSVYRVAEHCDLHHFSSERASMNGPSAHANRCRLYEQQLLQTFRVAESA
jgi:hypothetical protein